MWFGNPLVERIETGQVNGLRPALVTLNQSPNMIKIVESKLFDTCVLFLFLEVLQKYNYFRACQVTKNHIDVKKLEMSEVRSPIWAVRSQNLHLTSDSEAV